MTTSAVWFTATSRIGNRTVYTADWCLVTSHLRLRLWAFLNPSNWQSLHLIHFYFIFTFFYYFPRRTLTSTCRMVLYWHLFACCVYTIGLCLYYTIGGLCDLAYNAAWPCSGLQSHEGVLLNGRVAYAVAPPALGSRRLPQCIALEFTVPAIRVSWWSQFFVRRRLLLSDSSCHTSCVVYLSKWSVEW